MSHTVKNQKIRKMKSVMTLLFVAVLSISSFAKNDGIDPTKQRFKKWTKTFVNYPEEATIQQEEGVVYVSFEIGLDGETENLKIESGVSEKLDEKAIEMVECMPKKHLYQNGFTEGTVFVIPVKFALQ